MSRAIFRNTFRVTAATNLVESFMPAGGPVVDDNQLYVAIGREDDPQGAGFNPGDGLWPDDTIPPNVVNSESSDKAFWDTMIGAQRLSVSENMSLMIPRRSNTFFGEGDDVYRPYDETNPNIWSENIVLVNADNEVWLCLRAPSGSVALTTVPNANLPLSPDDFFLNDGLYSIWDDPGSDYRFKYLYTFSTAQAQNFLLNEWLPVNFGPTANASDTISQDQFGNGRAPFILNARYLLIRAELEAATDGSELPAGLNYRQIAFLKNPEDADGNRLVSSVAFAENTGYDNTTDPNSEKFTKYSGDILYIENRAPVFRQADQTEEIQTIITF